MKNILLIVIDTLRPDHLGCYGYERPTSPNLDRLAETGTRLDSLWSVSNFTAPAFTSLFTGLHPHHHGVFDFTAQATASPLSAVIEANRMETAGVVTFRFFQNLLRNIWGPIEAVTDTRGFDFSKNLPHDVTASALEWLGARKADDGPFCLFLHYDGPHTPFRIPDEHAHAFDSAGARDADPEIVDLLFPRAERLDPGRRKSLMYRFVKDVNWGRRPLSPATLQWIIDMYDAAVRYNDQAVGRILDGLQEMGIADETVVAVLSDHGEEFLEHGGFAHGGIHLYEEVIRTVGIIRDPDLARPGTVIDRPTSQVQMLAALLELAGAEGAPPTGLGRLLRGEDHEPGPVFCHGKSKIAVRHGAEKLIVSRPSPSLDRWTRLKMWINMARQRKLGAELFDLARDPGETRNLGGGRGARRKLRARLDEHLSAPAPGPFGRDDLSDAERQRIEQEMRDLGYM